MARIAIAISGGVDSSVAALLLREKGHEVLGLHMKLNNAKSQEGIRRRCCSLDEALDARAICRTLDLPFYVLDFQKQFRETVIDYFIQQYKEGKTPNPCVMCNRKIKSGLLMKKAVELGCDFLATGHYADIRKKEDTGCYQLVKPLDLRKDQTYFLHGVSPHDLPKMKFPLGKIKKEDVRRIAFEKKLISAEKEESQEICFVPSDYRSFLEKQSKNCSPKGRFENTEGEDLGEHKGLMYYTVGQRRGIGLSDSTPYYVVQLDNKNNKVILGKEKDLYIRSVKVIEMNWVSGPPRFNPFEAKAKLRYSQKETKARVIPLSKNRILIEMNIPVSSVSPGQAAVLYEKDVVLGGGWIESVSPMEKVETLTFDETVC